MADNFNISTTQSQSNEAGGLDNNNPAMTYVDFANQIANNANTQQSQNLAVQNAALMLKQKQQAAAQGINPITKGYLSKEEALALIQAELSRQNLLTDDVKAQVQSWYQAAPEMVEQQDVKDFISRYQPKEAKTGVSFVATATDAQNPSMFTQEGDHLVAGQTYFDTGSKDDDGNAIYERGGSLPATNDKSSQHAADEDRKDLKSLSTDLAKITNPSRGNWVSSNIGRVGRALSEINQHPDLPAPTLNYIQEEIGGIFMGGVPPQASLEESTVLDLKQRINQRLNYITGNPQIFKDNTQKNQQAQYLISLLSTLHQSTVELATQMMKAKAAGYPDLLKDRPDDVNNLLTQNMQILNAGLTQGAQSDLAAATASVTGTPPPAIASPAARKPLTAIFGQ